MARFGKPMSRASAPDTINLAGGQAHQMSPRLEFASALQTAFLKDGFYKSGAFQVDRIAGLARKLDDAEFMAKAAVFTRQMNGLRSVSHLVAGELAMRKDAKGQPWLRRFFRKVVVRPDDILETLAYLKANGSPELRNLSNALKRGFGEALSAFDAYQLSKYNRAFKDISMRDAVKLLHPKNTEALQALMKGKLKAADRNTWETRMTEVGRAAARGEMDQDGTKAARGQVWADLLKERKLGFQACLRNLVDIAREAPEAMDLALKYLTNPKAVENSRVFPFEFFTASEAMKAAGLATSQVQRALNEAMELSLKNAPEFEGPTLICFDNSGSMQGRPAVIAALFSAVLFKAAKDADVISFSREAVYVHANPGDSLQTLAHVFMDASKPHSTNFHAIFQTARRAYKRIIILSDMQAWVGGHTPAESLRDYRRRHNADPTIISFNLRAEDGTMQFPESKVCALAGFSDQVLALMKKLETDPQAMVHEIEALEL